MTTAPDPPRYFNLAEAARYLSISTTTLRRLIDSEALKVLRPSPGRVVLDRLALDEYLAKTAGK